MLCDLNDNSIGTESDVVQIIFMTPSNFLRVYKFLHMANFNKISA